MTPAGKVDYAAFPDTPGNSSRPALIQFNSPGPDRLHRAEGIPMDDFSLEQVCGESNMGMWPHIHAGTEQELASSPDDYRDADRLIKDHTITVLPSVSRCGQQKPVR